MFQITELPVETIIIKGRTRKVLGDLKKLKKSIIQSGQLNPILINEKNYLIAGERRLKAIKQLKQPTIICRIMPGLSPDDLLIIELMENIARKDFIWHEELELKYKLHNYWKTQAEEQNQKWGFRETAEKMDCSLGGLSSDLTLAAGVAVFPELKELESKAQARNGYKKIGDQAAAIQSFNNLDEKEKDRLEKIMSGESLNSNELQKSIPRAKHPDVGPLEEPSTDCSQDEPTREKHQTDIPEAAYLIEDYKTFLKKIPDNSVGFAELDPPYAIDFDTKYGNIGKRKATENDWKFEELIELYDKYFKILYNKLLDNSWLLCWTGVEHWKIANEFAAKSGFQIQAKPGIWIKPGGECNTPKTTMISNYEMFLLFRKDKATFNTNSMLSTVECNTTHGSNKVHQWEKPLPLYEHFFEILSRPGSLFISPFAGSGNSMIIAAKNKMIPMGCDKRQKYALSFYERYNKYFIKDI